MPSEAPIRYLEEARALVARGTPAAVVTIVTGDRIGAKLLVTDDTVQGSIGSSGLDSAAVESARTALATRKSGLVNLVDGVDAFVDVYPLPPLLILVGAVHVAQAVATFAKPLGFRIVVVDARQALATRDRFPDADEIMVAWPDEAYPQLPISNTTAIVILTHDPKFDEPAILGALKTDAGYIGAVGSRKTNIDRRERLLEAGVSDDDLARVHGPIGLNIGGRTPEEMAISILGEIIAVRNDRPGGMLRAATGNIRADGN